LRRTFIGLILLTIILAGCSLAGDITPPPAIATAQAAVPATSAPTLAPQATQEVELAEASIPPSSIKPDLISGQAIYFEKCVACHGVSGLGDGEQAANLDHPPTKLGDSTVARSATPNQWFDIVTNGRIDRLMPPFSSLDDIQRWDVVAFALSLGSSDEERVRGEEVYSSVCANCHGLDGSGEGESPSLTDFPSVAESSTEEWFELVTSGRGAMPAFATQLSEEDRWAAVTYARSLAFVSEPPAQEEVDASEETSPLASIRGVVVNGTTGELISEGNEITLVGIDGQALALTTTSHTDEFGAFSFEDLEQIPGRIYGVIVEHQGVEYFSEGTHIVDDEQDVELSITVFDSSPDTSAVNADRLHILFDVIEQGQLTVTEVWLLTNQGVSTVASAEDLGGLEISLPPGFSALSFFDEFMLEGKYQLTDSGFFNRGPIRPFETTEMVFGFDLPFTSRLEFTQPISIPVEGVTLLAPETGFELSGESLQDLGVREIGGVFQRTYSVGPISPGGRLELEITSTSSLLSHTSVGPGLLIGLLVLGAAVGYSGFWWFQKRKRAQIQEAQPQEPPADRDSLMQMIAALDDTHEAGEIDDEEYHHRRAALKERALELMRGEND
jgi:mono/diheme cytochrome c family protein